MHNKQEYMVKRLDTGPAVGTKNDKQGNGQVLPVFRAHQQWVSPVSNPWEDSSSGSEPGSYA